MKDKKILRFSQSILKRKRNYIYYDSYCSNPSLLFILSRERKIRKKEENMLFIQFFSNIFNSVKYIILSFKTTIQFKKIK